ncbi:esterase-like activity of phytase family protein, partial [bacterium]|nr:esterase-like activity of phytase family protein [bacterium]
LPDIGLSEFLAQPPLSLAVEDHNINLGGIGSDMWHGNGDGPSIYWMITDRGPNGEDPRTFPVTEFTPIILKVRTTNGEIEILQSIPITGLNAATEKGVTGLANLNNLTGPPALNEPFFDCFGEDGEELEPNPHGLDTEGIVRTSDGTFWIIEEYGPSILNVDSQGKVVKRFFPDSFLQYLDPITGYATDDSSLSIPEIFGLKRKLNRGFEGIAISPNQKTLYIALQSPLVNPNTATGNASRVTRILAFDIATEQVIGEYVYRFQFTTDDEDVIDEFDVPEIPDEAGMARPRDMKISAIAMLDEHRMLVLERTDFKAKIFRVDLRDATNILGTVWDDVNTSPSLETFNNDGVLQSHGINPLSPKVEVLTLNSIETINGIDIPEKIEGMTVLDGKTIAVANDNDFGVGAFDIDLDGDPPTCNLIDSGKESQIIVIRLDKPLKQ